MTGKFEGTGEWVRVTNDGTNWFLDGGSQQSGVAGEATCFPRDSFLRPCTKPVCPPPTTARLLGEATLTVWTRDIANACTAFETSFGSGATFHFISGMQGKTWGSGEWAQVLQSPSVNTPSFLQANLCARASDLWATASGFSTPATSGLATFVDSAGNRGDLNQVAEFTATGNAVVTMAPASRAMCAFTKIQGGFRGAGESVQIRSETVSGTEKWVLRTTQGRNFGISANARCFARTQR